jgi:hypothetical protein
MLMITGEISAGFDRCQAEEGAVCVAERRRRKKIKESPARDAIELMAAKAISAFL